MRDFGDRSSLRGVKDHNRNQFLEGEIRIDLETPYSSSLLPVARHPIDPFASERRFNPPHSILRSSAF